MPAANDELTITFSARLWAPIDGAVDNSVALAHVDGDASIYEPGQRIREAGWAAMRTARETNDIGWPPEDYQMPITASRIDWVFVLAQLDRWEHYDDVSSYRSARQAITDALTAVDG